MVQCLDPSENVAKKKKKKIKSNGGYRFPSTPAHLPGVASYLVPDYSASLRSLLTGAATVILPHAQLTVLHSSLNTESGSTLLWKSI